MVIELRAGESREERNDDAQQGGHGGTAGVVGRMGRFRARTRRRLNRQTKTESRDFDTIRPIIRAIHGTLYLRKTGSKQVRASDAMAFCTNCIFAAEKDGCPAAQSTMLTLTYGVVDGLPVAHAVLSFSEHLVALNPQARHAPRLCSLGGAAETDEPRTPLTSLPWQSRDE